MSKFHLPSSEPLSMDSLIAKYFDKWPTEIETREVMNDIGMYLCVCLTMCLFTLSSANKSQICDPN